MSNTKRICKSCDNELNVGDKYCSNCGALFVPDTLKCEHCHKVLRKSVKYCPHCGTKVGMSDSVSEVSLKTKDSKNIKGIGGWLLFFIISLGLSIIRFFSKIPSNVDCKNLGDYRDACYDLLDFGNFNSAVLMFFVFVFFIVIVLIASKNKWGKRFAIGALLSYAIIGTFWQINIFTAYNFPSYFNTQAVLELLGILLYATVWSAYLLKSRRVKNTLATEDEPRGSVKGVLNVKIWIGIAFFLLASLILIVALCVGYAAYLLLI